MTFQTVGGTTRKLGDFKPVSVDGAGRFGQNSFYITFYDQIGKQRLVKNDEQIKALWPATETDSAVMDKPVRIAYSTTAGSEGWYLSNDYQTKKYKLNDYVLSDGDGFQIFAQANTFKHGVYLTCSGEVAAENLPITVNSGYYSFTGNITPAPVKLGQLTPVSVDGAGRFGQNSFYITFYDKIGKQRLVKDDEQIKALWPASETDAAVKDKPVRIAYSTTAGSEGWYLSNDYQTKKYKLNDYVIQPSEGFQMFAQANTFKHGVTIEFPSALPKSEEAK